MNRLELRSFLINNNTNEAPDWNVIKELYHPKTIEVNGQEVYLFNLSFDSSINPVEDSIVIWQQLPTAFVPMHIHHYIEMIYVYQGECTVDIEKREIPLTEGGIIIIDKNIPHTVKDISATDIVIDIKLKQDFLSSGFLSRFTNKSIISQFLIESLINKRNANNYLSFPLESRSNVVGIMDQIMCEYFDKDFCSNDMINAYLFILLTELIRHSNRKTSHHDHTTQNGMMVFDFLKYIEDHYKECSLTEMAAYFRYHPNYISAVLKKATGKSFKELLQIQRLNKAAQYLSNTDLPIPDIAEEVGYSSVSFFYKKFNEVFDQTPKAYRENQD
ncbi:AraC family transcriptional regulator [Bacillus sp. MRMR6]|uniref:AraC family transcriptional regulator n=1 Tax=Bacillus sp. MRMR6 TaxID=1928617 RepID=UPI0009533927|nr:AraC family transcriptional regulator [Bacillus sp. MRMR6]OLS42200.1 AraC family transcriptional regulator [Bacillus sp. MRMR6]